MNTRFENNMVKYQVFLSYNSKDRSAVQWIAERLEDEAKVRVFLDVWDLVPGVPWQEHLEKALERSQTVAVFLGPHGISSWLNKEMRDAINRQVRNPNHRVIPVILPGPDMDKVDLPNFLSQTTWVDFRNGLEDPDALHRLISGIAGEPPGRGPGGLRPNRPAPTLAISDESLPSFTSPTEERASIFQNDRYRDQKIDTGGGVYIGGGVNTGGGDFVGRDKITTYHATMGSGDLSQAFASIYLKIQARPFDPDLDNEEISQQVKKIEKEVQLGDPVGESRLMRLFCNLGEMAPDIFDVVTDTLANPIKGVATIVQKIAKKARANAQHD